MKKLKYLLLLLLVVPMIAKADVNAVTGDSIEEGKEVDSSSAIFGNEITSNNTTKGIEALFGYDINFNGTSDYALVLGNNININGTVNNDAFVFGGVVNINDNANINRDLVILGNEVKINGNINRDVRIYAISVVINANITDNLTINAENIDINGASVGTLSYNKDAVVDIDDNAKINETILTDEIYTEQTTVDKIMNFIINLVSILVFFTVICLIIPQLFKRINKKNENIDTLGFFSLFGFGALSLVLIPAIFLLLFRFVFTIPLALLLLVLFVIAICVSTVFAGYLLGFVIWKKLMKKEDNPLIIGLIGLSILSVLTFIPNVGIVFSFIAVIVGMGIILQQFRKD